jgi:hypothetical protein
MRMTIWIVGALAVGVYLDSWLYNGHYTDGILRMLTAMKHGFGFG